MFWINGYRKNNWTLEGYDGGDKVIPLHSSITTSEDVIEYSSNSVKLNERGHSVNLKLLSKFRRQGKFIRDVLKATLVHLSFMSNPMM